MKSFAGKERLPSSSPCLDIQRLFNAPVNFHIFAITVMTEKLRARRFGFSWGARASERVEAKTRITFDRRHRHLWYVTYYIHFSSHKHRVSDMSETRWNATRMCVRGSCARKLETRIINRISDLYCFRVLTRRKKGESASGVYERSKKRWAGRNRFKGFNDNSFATSDNNEQKGSLSSSHPPGQSIKHRLLICNF